MLFMEPDVRAIRPKRWTREEYDRMIAAGLFVPGERLELLEGEILQMTPQGSLHATAIQLIHEAMRQVFGLGFVVRNQMPLVLDPFSEPEPDIAVVAGNVLDYRSAHPATALLIVEVSDTSLELDRMRKSSTYARAGIPEYWVVNLIDKCVELFREPDGEVYRSIRRLEPGESIRPFSAPHAEIPVAILLP